MTSISAVYSKESESKAFLSPKMEELPQSKRLKFHSIERKLEAVDTENSKLMKECHEEYVNEHLPQRPGMNNRISRIVHTTTVNDSPAKQSNSLTSSVLSHNFQMNIARYADSMMSEGTLHNVVLVSSDFEEFLGHMVVLSACSGFFRAVLARLQGQVPHTFFIKGVRGRELRAALEYIYQGKTCVSHDNLQTFMEIAKDSDLMGWSRRKTMCLKKT